jgi:hypothetical protein
VEPTGHGVGGKIQYRSDLVRGKVLTPAALNLLKVAALMHYFADDVAAGVQLPDKPCNCIYKARMTNGGTEVKGFEVNFRGITERSHHHTVQLRQHLARCRTHLALHHEYSAAALNSTQSNPAPVPARLEDVLAIDATGANH